MADEQHRVHWGERATYLAVLRELKEAVVREMDLAQVGAEGSKRLTQAMDAAHIAKVRYRQQCMDASPTAPVPMDLQTFVTPVKKSRTPKPS